ncbi:hypothetical protein AADG42_17895 [Ammonicoccus fulvus]|uniref:Uncharacterized protein n=1 Tax=Ammonicoccus fulvus TaxID=3138240 RepID=A0ABZ3FWD5_9ACTN
MNGSAFMTRSAVSVCFTARSLGRTIRFRLAGPSFWLRSTKVRRDCSARVSAPGTFSGVRVSSAQVVHAVTSASVVPCPEAGEAHAAASPSSPIRPSDHVSSSTWAIEST